MVMKPLLLAAAVSFVPLGASASIFNVDQARTFCADRGEFPRFVAKRVVTRCDARYRPDLRQVKLCVEDVRDNRGKSGRRFQ